MVWAKVHVLSVRFTQATVVPRNALYSPFCGLFSSRYAEDSKKRAWLMNNTAPADKVRCACDHGKQRLQAGNQYQLFECATGHIAAAR